MAFSSLDAACAAIADPSTDIIVKLGRIRDLGRTFALENQRDPEYQRATATLFPILIDSLKTGSPVWKRIINEKENVEHALRYQTLELLHKFTNSELIRPHLVSLAPLLLDLARTDTEDIAVTSIKMFNELVRASRPLMETQIPLFIRFTVDLFNESEAYVEELFSPTGAAMVEPDRTVFPKGFPSLKLLSETLVLCNFLYQMGTPAFIAQFPTQTLVDAVAKLYTLQVSQETEKDEDHMDEDIVHYGPPPSIINKAVFMDLVSAQIKIGPLLGYIIKKDPTLTTSELWPRLSQEIPPASIRMLRVMSPEAYIIRREALAAIRNLSITDLKATYPDSMQYLLDERLVFGNLRSEPGLCLYTYSTIGETYQQVRPHISIQQVLPFLRRFAELVSDSSLPQSMLTLVSKLLVGSFEHLNGRLRTGEAPTADVALQVNTVMHALIETICTRVQNAVTNGQRLMALRDGNASEEIKQLAALEQSRTVPVIFYLANDNYEGSLMDERFFVRASAMCFKMMMQIIRTLNGRVPDADVMGRAFKNLCLAVPLMRGDSSESSYYKVIAETFSEMEPHVFQMVWTTNMDMFFTQVLTQPNLTTILTWLYQQPSTVYSLTALVLRYLTDNLETLLENTSPGVAIIIRTIRITFMSVATLGDGLERVVFPHLPRLLVDVFAMAARSQDPRNFLSVPYYMFRALGQKNNNTRYETFHKEIFPLLPEVLDGVNRALEMTEDAVQREQLVEISLTTPARLQHLAPYMAQLWRPLVLALGSRSPELLRQGLRTLELAAENLSNIDLLDPEAEPVARDLVLALHRVLKPGAAVADLSQAASRILGKIGGRNRRILSTPPSLSYEKYTVPATIPVEFTSHVAPLQVLPACEVAVKVLGDGKAGVYHDSAFNLLRTQVLFLLQTGVDNRAAEDLFLKSLDGLVSSIHLSNVEPAANELLREIAKALFEMELAKETGPMPGRKLTIAPITGQFLDSVVAVLMTRPNGNHTNARRLIANIIQELHDRGQGDDRERKRNTAALVGSVVSKFVSFCWQTEWRKKVAGCAGISVLISDEIHLGYDWPYTKEVEICRSLVTALKDMPQDPPAEVPEIKKTIIELIRFCNPPRFGDQMEVDNDRTRMSPEEQAHHDWVHKTVAEKGKSYMNLIHVDLHSQNKTVRETTHECLALFADLSGVKLSEFVRPLVDKVTSNIYGKPLRMFSAMVQIGHMESMTYLLSLDPPVIQPSEELWRLLNEVVALAEADEQATHPMNPMHKMGRRATQLNAMTKAAAIRLVTAAFPISDYFQKQAPVRQRATTLLFQALYSSNVEIKTAAHDGLKVFLGNQNRLPREHLQAGLRPVLMNLADPAKLTVASLEGLARLLGLLTNYFKVEIATKLIDHFKALSDNETLRDAAYGPIADNETISKLVRLLHIFPLLPPAANTYLEQVVALVVDTERNIHAASPTPFTPPLSAYLDRFPLDSLNILFEHIKEPRWVQTFRHVVQGKEAPHLVTELKTRGTQLAQAISGAEHANAALPSILLCLDLAEADPEWMSSQEAILEALKVVWGIQFTEVLDDAGFNYSRLVLIRALYTIWIKVFKVTPRVDLLFNLSLIFTHPLETNYSEVIEFVSLYVANQTTLAFKRQAVQYFVTALDEASVTESHLVQYLRMVVIPLLTAEFRQAESPDDVLSDGLIVKMSEKIWAQHPSAEWSPAFAAELLHMTGILVSNVYSRIGNETSKTTRGTVAKYIWDHLKLHEPPAVRNAASLAAARFLSNKEAANERFQNMLWAALLKVSQDGEPSPITRQALDIMLPVMVRAPAVDPSNKWDVVISKTLSEEQHIMSTTVNIYRLIIRHADQCYPSRELFIPLLIPGLSRLGFQSASQAENRVLAGDVIDLITNWLRRAAEEEKNEMVLDSASPSTRWVMPSNLKDAIVAYLIRYSISMPDTYTKVGLTARHLTQLKTLSGLDDWKTVSVRIGTFARSFETPDNADPAAIGGLISNVKVLSAISSQKPQEWFVANSVDLFTYSKRAMTASQDVLVESFAPIFERFVETLAFGKEGTELTGLAAEVYQWISDTLRDFSSNGSSNLATLAILTAVVKSAPSRVEPFAGGLMRLYSKLVKDHVSLSQQQMSEPAAAQTVQRLFSALEISSLSVAHFGENRKVLLHGLVQLAGSSANPEMRRRLLAITREWVLGPPITFPTAKEKASLMCKMQAWHKFGDAIYRDYLNLVYDVYSTPSMARTDLTVRLETSFILGCRVDDLSIRRRFLELFSESIPKAIGPRIAYVIGGQSWEIMNDFNWIYVVLDMIIGAINGEAIISPKEYALPTLTKTDIHAKDVLQPMRPLLFYDMTVMHRTFVSLFPEIWTGLVRKEQADITASIVHVLGKDNKPEIARPNLYQSLLGAVQRCTPPMALPPHVLKYLVKAYHAWYEGLEILQGAVDQGRDDDGPIQEANQDALALLYAELSEDDYYYGLWRRRSLFEETNAALSYEQNGFYHFAQPLYEFAQMRARQGMYPMSESEYYVWEDHWILCSEKLLMWDILGDIAASEANADLALECAWRSLQTWNADNVTVTNYLNQHPQDPATPRRLFFKAYWTLNSMAHTAREQQQQQATAQGSTNYLPVKLDIGPESEFAKIVDQANQITLTKWVSLPEALTMAHVPLLAQFQQVIELKEAALLMTTLLATNRDNLPEKAHEAKSIFHHWRERLPLPHDDIGVWHDLISWRQHVFHAVNKFYLPLLPEAPAQANASTHAHRGHHESAWIINRFAHVARKHGLLQVCQSSLSDIYKLPNIEISEAFLKLREQARCHLETPGELYQGLEVINNTNLMYFTAPQKAEFFAMKGLFLHKMERHEDANAAFGQAVQLDFSMPKAWMLWGVYSDDMHTVNPTDFSLAANAVSCYLQAASLYKSGKSRPLFNRILWLLSMDDQQQTVGKMWEVFKGEHVYWYWITLIPQLISSLSNKEGRYAHQILLNIAKLFPQAVFYQLRAHREEHNQQRRDYLNRMQIKAQNDAAQANAAGGQTASDVAQPAVANPDVVMAAPPAEGIKHGWDMADELVTLLKTAHPLLALTMEQFAEQIRERLKPGPEEEVHRMSSALLNEALTGRSLPGNRNASTVSAQLHLNAKKLIGLVPSGALREEMETQLFGRVPTMNEFVRSIIYLRDQFEVFLERKSKIHSMDVWSHYLVEFHISRFEKMSIPGQYLEHRDSNAHFVDIKRISTRLERCRSPLAAFRRIALIGQDGSTHTFTVQYYLQFRPIRRDERFMQLSRIFNETLLQKKEARKRNLQFHILTSVSLNPNLRLVKLDSSYIGLVEIHDEYCKSRGFGRDEPLLQWQDKLRAYYEVKGWDTSMKEEDIQMKEIQHVRLEAKTEVETKYIPRTVLSNYMKRTMKDSYSLWTMRKQFTLQIAMTNFLTYCMFLNTRAAKILISRETGLIGLGESSITLNASLPMLQPNDTTPFRLTPNVQDFITPIGMEGLMTAALLSLSRGLLEPECEIQKQMWLFVRDDFMLWFRSQGRNPATNERLEFRIAVADAIEKILKKMSSMCATNERKNAQLADGPASMPTVAVVSAIQQLINLSTNPGAQAKNVDWSYPWY